eukprot:5166731-Alexandrium_andersonii.AAC.1
MGQSEQFRLRRAPQAISHALGLALLREARCLRFLGIELWGPTAPGKARSGRLARSARSPFGLEASAV